MMSIAQVIPSMTTVMKLAFPMGLFRIQELPWYLILSISAIGGYASYRAGAEFGGIVFHSNAFVAMTGIMIEWIIALPLLLYIYRKLVSRKSNKIKQSVLL